MDTAFVFILCFFSRSHHQHGGKDGACPGSPRINQNENKPLQKPRRSPGYEYANDITFIYEYENNRPRSVALVESTDEITPGSGPVHSVQQCENNAHSNHSLGELQRNQRGFPSVSNEEEEMSILRKENKPKRKGRSHYELCSNVNFLSEYMLEKENRN